MTILGLDVSHWNDLAHDPVNVTNQGYDFLFWKATEGSTYKDSTFPGMIPESYGTPLFAAYHFMDSSNARLQANNVKSVVPLAVPVIVDMERGDIATAQDLHKILQDMGYTTPLFYLPMWYWKQINSPDVSHFPPLWASSYVAGSDYGSVLYNKVAASNWVNYGGNSVYMLQFTDKGRLDGVHTPVDISAFPGSRGALDNILHTEHRTIPVPLPIPTYTVVAGDTLSSIAFKLLGDSNLWVSIAASNAISNPNRIQPGQVLRIPGWNGEIHGPDTAIRYTVESNDSLTSIAKRFGSTVEIIYAANRRTIGSNPNLIRPGMVLNIPRLA